MAKNMKKSQVASAEMDALEVVREMTIVNDKFQRTFRSKRKEAIQLAEQLYPAAVEAGMDFMHKGQIYNVSETKKKYDFTHVTIDPVFQQWRDNRKLQAEAKEGETSILKEIQKRFPHLYKPKSSTKVLKVKRQKKADRRASGGGKES